MNNEQMKVSVLFFGATADAAGTRESELELADGASAVDALAAVTSAHPALHGRNLLYAVNQEYAKGDEVLSDGDELAVFTAVSGG